MEAAGVFSLLIIQGRCVGVMISLCALTVVMDWTSLHSWMI